MSLIVEDGTGLANAESYISVAAADTRHSNNGMTNWATLQTSDKEAALRRATNFMEQAFRERWKGMRLHKGQALSWPRWNLLVDGYPVDPNSIPAEVASACADLALKAASGDLNADLTQMVVEKGVGPLRKVFNRNSPERTRYPSIEMALAPFLTSTGANVQTVRA